MSPSTERIEHYTIIIRVIHETLGDVVVVIPGEHDLNFIVALEYPLYAGKIVKDRLVLLKERDREICEELLSLAETYLYMLEGTVITSSDQPHPIDVEGEPSEEWYVNTDRYGLVDVTYVASVQIQTSTFVVFTSNPFPDVYLVLLLEDIGTAKDNTPLYGAVVDDELRVAIIGQVLIDLDLNDCGESDTDYC